MPVVDDRITLSLAGKPVWALHVRLAAVWWQAANECMNKYLDACEANDRTAARVAAAATVYELEPVYRLVSEVTVPGRDECLGAVQAIATAVGNGDLPPQGTYEAICEFFEFAWS